MERSAAERAAEGPETATASKSRASPRSRVASNGRPVGARPILNAPAERTSVFGRDTPTRIRRAGGADVVALPTDGAARPPGQRIRMRSTPLDGGSRPPGQRIQMRSTPVIRREYLDETDGEKAWITKSTKARQDGSEYSRSRRLRRIDAAVNTVRTTYEDGKIDQLEPSLTQLVTRGCLGVC